MTQSLQQKEISANKLYGLPYGLALHRLVQFRADQQRGEDVARALIDAAAPAPKPRGPYKKREEHEGSSSGA